MWRRLPLASPCCSRRTALRLRRSGDSGEPEVVASFYPLQYVAQRVVGDHAEVANLTQPGVEPHDLELAAAADRRDRRRRRRGLREGASSPPSTTPSTEQRPRPHVVDAADAVHLRHGSTSEDGDIDPHFWQDPTLLAKVADAFTDEMREGRPDARGATTRAQRRRAATRPARRSTASYRAGPRALPHPHDRGQPRRVRVPRRALRPRRGRRSPASPPTPSRRRRDLPELAGPDPRPTGSPPSSPSGWPAPSSPRPWPATWASTPRCSTRSRG